MSSFEPVRKSALSEEIAGKILDMIRAGDLLPGERLPAERELAAALEVSRPSLREALRALSLMNIIEIRQGDGTYVSSLEPDQLVEHLDFVFSLDDSTFHQLFDARKIVEVGMVGLAAERITEEQIAELEACLARSYDSVDDHTAFLEVDIELHDLIMRAAGNPILTRFMTSIRQLTLASRSRTVAIPGVPSRALRDHERIVSALKARDPQAAQQAMLDHLKQIEQGVDSPPDQQE